MRPSSRLATLWITALAILAILFTLSGLAPAQAATKSKRKLAKKSPPTANMVMAQPATASAPVPLTADSWTGTSGDNSWGTAGNWSAGVPSSSSAVTIGTSSANVNLTSGTGSFGSLALSGTGDTLAIANNAVMDAFGNITNNGTINLNSSGNFTELVLESNVTLSGTGTLSLSNNANNFIFGAVASDQLTNQQTIQGAGQIGNGKMALVNSGTINANLSAGLTINANNGFTNTGTAEATSGSKLTLQSTGVNNVGGTISANTGTINVSSSVISGGNVTLTGASTLQLNTGTIGGGTITNSATGTIEVATGTNAMGGTINNSAGGLLKIDNNAVLDLQGGTYSQLGTVQLNSSGNFTELVLAGNVTLSGGTVTLSNNANNFIFGTVAANTLTNKETISGAGNIGNGKMTLVNSGTINANQSAGMTLAANGGVTNTGTLEATSGSSLTMSSTGTINNVGGTISANTGTLNLNSSTINGGTVTLTGASALKLNTGVIHGGSTLTNSATGTIEIATGTNTLGGIINNSAGGTFKIDNNAILDLEGGTYSQLGNVQLNSSGNFTELVLEGNVTLSGGSLTLSNNANNFIFGQISGNTLTNQETISGAGHIGNNQMTLVNSGTINSNQSAGMTIQANGGVTNTGTLEATSGATLLMNSTGVINNTGGTITANTGTLQLTSSTINGGAVTLTGASALQLNSGTIHGGSTLTNSSTGTIEAATGTSLLGGTINNSAGGILKVDNNAVLQLDGGTYSQLGSVQLNSSGNFTELVLEGNVTLSGGTVTLSNNANNFIFGQISSDTLTNQETIQGAGHIGNNQMTLVNSGTINSNQSAGMTIQANGGATNTGTIEATSGATLALASTTLNNAGGTISANTGTVQVTSSTVNGGSINLTGASALQLSNGTVHGGSTITNSSTGTIEMTAGTSVLGGTINNSAGGILKVDNNAILQLEGGTYSQIGAVQLNSSGNFTELVIEGNTTLSGGTITMSGNANNFILGAAPFNVLTNQATIQGAGNIGNGGMGLVNTGTINANASGNLIINVSNQNFNNTGGTIEATGATLTIQGPGATYFTNDNESTNTLTGGTYIANGSNIQWNHGGSAGITTLAANVTEEGGGQLINTFNGANTNMLSGLTSITSTGALTIGGTAFTDAGSFSNAGSLTLLSGESFTVGSLSQISGGSLTAGTYVLNANLNLSGTAQTITTNAATLTLSGGTIENTSNSTNALAGLATNSGKLTIGGTSNNVSTTASTFSNTGTLTINSGDSLSATKLTQISGTTLSGGTFVLGGNLNLTTAGISIATNSSTLTLQGGTINSNGVNALALTSSTKSLTLANNANLATATTGNFTNSGTVTVNSGSTLTVGGTSHSYKQTAGTTTVDGTLSGGTSGTTSFTGGTLQGAGKITGNTSVGNATGTAVTINVGDSGKSGLLAITGTYTQLATGNMTGLINGTTAGSGFSQLTVSGSAALAGTINFTVASSFQSSLVAGQTFTVLTASSVTGTFSNATIAINSSFHFNVSYTATGVVLTVAAGPVGAPASALAQPVALIAMAAPKHVARASRIPMVANGLRHATTSSMGKTRPILIAARPISGRSNAIFARGSDLSDLHSWERVPVMQRIPAMATSGMRPVAVTAQRSTANEISSRTPLPKSDLRIATGPMMGLQSHLLGSSSNTVNRRMPVKILPRMMPRINR